MPQQHKKKTQITLDNEVLEKVRYIAKQEKRTTSRQISVWIDHAIRDFEQTCHHIPK